jgi:hypothetical protein
MDLSHGFALHFPGLCELFISKIACRFATKIVPTAIFLPLIVAIGYCLPGSAMPFRLHLSTPPPALVGGV